MSKAKADAIRFTLSVELTEDEYHAVLGGLRMYQSYWESGKMSKTTVSAMRKIRIAREEAQAVANELDAYAALEGRVEYAEHRARTASDRA